MIGFVGAEASAQLAELHARAFAQPWNEADIARLLHNPVAFALRADAPADAPAKSPAKSPGSALGFILAWAPGGDAEILTIAIAPEHRRAGIGLALTEAAMAAALARGAGAMFLEVAEDNGPARALYAKLGFAPSGRRSGYYQRAEGVVDALLLRRALPRP
jgi:ribosomal-protein-alanine N-acetyltransferase